MRRGPTCCLAVASLLGLPWIAGCHITRSGQGHDDNVHIGTPFGDVRVKTGPAADTQAIGLTPYPDAVPEQKQSGDDANADVNFSFGKFQMHVHAAKFLSSDAPDKVEAFYRRDLAKYGDVIACRGGHAVGQPTRTAEGLTCNDDGERRNIHVGGDSGSSLDLRAGSPRRQHIAAVGTTDGQTSIGLVSLELPRDFSADGDRSE